MENADVQKKAPDENPLAAFELRLRQEEQAILNEARAANRILPLRLLGSVEIFVGLVLVICFRFLPSPWEEGTAGILNDIFKDIGVGLLCTGILTITLGVIDRKHREHEIQHDDKIRQLEIKNNRALVEKYFQLISRANLEAILKNFMPPEIFRSVMAQIVEKSIVRTDVNSLIILSFHEDRRYLIKEQTTRYKVVNVGQASCDHTIRVTHERQHENESKVPVSIDRLIIERDAGTVAYLRDGEKFAGATVQHDIEKITDKDSEIELSLSVKESLAPGESFSVEVRTRCALSVNETFPYVMMYPTVGLEVRVNHPQELLVQCWPLHPENDSGLRVVYREWDRVKEYRIDGGILPFQGVQLNIRPQPPKPTSSDQTVSEPQTATTS